MRKAEWNKAENSQALLDDQAGDGEGRRFPNVSLS